PDQKKKLVLNVREFKSKKPASNIIRTWKDKIELTVIPDIFNDKLNYTCVNYADLVRLNKEMLAVVHKYELFGDGEKAKNEVNKFLENFQLIRDNGLKQIQKKLTVRESSDLQILEKNVNNINSEIENMVSTNESITFTMTEIKCSYCNSTNTPLNCYSDGVMACNNNENCLGKRASQATCQKGFITSSFGANQFGGNQFPANQLRYTVTGTYT
ncbi:unnamed protein product, partial [Didymodactylos carnosus]